MNALRQGWATAVSGSWCYMWPTKMLCHLLTPCAFHACQINQRAKLSSTYNGRPHKLCADLMCDELSLQVQGYSKVIKCPMDLGTILTKAKKRQYNNEQEVGARQGRC